MIFSRKLFFLLLTSFIAVYGNCSTFYANDSVPLFKIVNGQVFLFQENKTIFNTEGNIIFNGLGQDKEDILYLSTAKNIFSRSKSFVFNDNRSRVLLSISKGQFRYGESEFTFDEDILFQVNKTEKGLTFYNWQNQLLGFCDQNEFTQTELIAAFFIYNNIFRLDEKAAKRIEVKLKELAEQSAGDFDGGIRPVWGNRGYTEWIMEGDIIKPRFAGSVHDQWYFDGEILRPNVLSNVNEQYSWDGEILKPLWRNASHEEFIWDGEIFKPYWHSNANLEFEIVGNRVKPAFFSQNRSEWEIEGNLPVPVVMAIVLGIIQRRR